MFGPLDSETHIPHSFIPSGELVAQVSDEIFEQTGEHLFDYYLPSIIQDLTRNTIRKSLEGLVRPIHRGEGR